MKVEAKLVRQGLRICRKFVSDAPLLKERKINVRMSTTEYAPVHLNVAVGGYLGVGWHTLFCKRHANRPSAKNVPMNDPS